MILMASRDLSRSPLGKISHSSAVACMRLDEATTLKKPVDRLTKCQVLGGALHFAARFSKIPC
jgi:hypothetical protein